MHTWVGAFVGKWVCVLVAVKVLENVPCACGCEPVLAAAVRLILFLSACGCTRVCLCRHTWVIITERHKNTKFVLR